MKVFVVTMYQYGNHHSHSYVLGVWSSKRAAMRAGEIEAAWRGSKYEPEVTPWNVNANEYDKLEVL